MKYRAISENHLYGKAYAKGKKYAGNYVVIYVLRDYFAAKLRRENPLGESINRIGLTVRKKQGGAVIRNRMKRIIREAYRQIDCAYHIERGNLIVIVARDAVKTAKMQDVRRDMKKGLIRLSMIDATRTEHSE